MTDLEIIVPVRPEGEQEAALAACLDGIAKNTAVVTHVVHQVAFDKVLQAIVDSTAEYVAVLPPSHAIADPGWFGKMQTPFLRTPSCGLTISADDPAYAGKGVDPFPWKARAGAPGDLVFAPRETIIAIARAAKLLHYSEALYLAANGLGFITWAVPNVRIDIAGAKAPSARTQSPNAHRPG
jgi:hypothetical protein